MLGSGRRRPLLLRREVLAVFIACGCLSGIYLFGTPWLFDVWISGGTPKPVIPAYPAARDVRVSQSYHGGVHTRQERFVTADTPAEVKAKFGRSLGPPGGRWYSGTWMDKLVPTIDGPERWYYNPKYCPIVSVQVTFPRVEPGLTEVELTTRRSICLDQFPFRALPWVPVR